MGSPSTSRPSNSVGSSMSVVGRLGRDLMYLKPRSQVQELTIRGGEELVIDTVM